MMSATEMSFQVPQRAVSLRVPTERATVFSSAAECPHMRMRRLKLTPLDGSVFPFWGLTSASSLSSMASGKLITRSLLFSACPALRLRPDGANLHESEHDSYTEVKENPAAVAGSTCTGFDVGCGHQTERSMPADLLSS